jgi:hypothetical protein
VTQAFALCPSLEVVVPALLAGGVAQLQARCVLTAGVPVHCMLAKVATGGADVLRQVSFLGDAKSSLGDAESSLGDAKSSLGDAESSLGDAESSLGDA